MHPCRRDVKKLGVITPLSRSVHFSEMKIDSQPLGQLRDGFPHERGTIVELKFSPPTRFLCFLGKYPVTMHLLRKSQADADTARIKICRNETDGIPTIRITITDGAQS